MSQRPFLLKSATLLAILVSVFLIIGKIIAYVASRSLSIQASLFDSCLDGIISIVNYFAVRHALVPADSDHGFGHGKAEALAGLLQSVFIAGSAFWLFYEIYSHITHPRVIDYDGTAIWVMCGASVLTGMLILWQKYVTNRTQSIAISADCLHYQADLYTNIAVLLSIILSQYFNTLLIDGITAAIIACYILKTAIGIGMESFNILMDRELDEQTIKKIRGIISQHTPHYRHLKTRSCGHRYFIQCTLLLQEHHTLQEAQALITHLKNDLAAQFEHVDVVIETVV